MFDFNDLLSSYQTEYANRHATEMSLTEYLELCKKDPSTYATTAERMLTAIGDAEVVDTSKDERLSRIYGNRKIKVFPAFKDEFFGIEEVIERVVAYFQHAAQGLEERKQVLYFLGPVGSSKSSLAEKCKQLIETQPIYALKAGDDISPVFESPLGLFERERFGKHLEEAYGIPQRRLTTVMSPWAVKRLAEFKGDITKFRVVRLMPSRVEQVAVAKTEPGDANNSDISTLVGKVDIRKLELHSQNDSDAYSYSGGLCRANQGILEMVEMFKAPLPVLHPLLTATQEGNYVGTENIGAIPFNGIVLAHSNEAEWQTFKNNKTNEAFIDRIFVVKVPYCLRVTEEERIYDKLINNSELAKAPCAPGTKEMLARFSVLSRLKEHDNSNLWSKMQVYDGMSLKEKDPKARSVQEYQKEAGVDEGMTGISTRFAFKALAATYNFSAEEVAADPIHLMMVLEAAVMREQFPEKVQQRLLGILAGDIRSKFAEDIGKIIQKAFLESYDEFGQNLFERYVDLAHAWIQDKDYVDPDTGMQLNRAALDTELSKVEKPALIANPRDFRNDVVMHVLGIRARGKTVRWTDYEKFREVLEKRMFSQTEDLLPVISFGAKSDSELDKKHHEFVKRMISQGYTPLQTRRLVEWFMRMSKSS